jgi:hypothetical protein
MTKAPELARIAAPVHAHAAHAGGRDRCPVDLRPPTRGSCAIESRSALVLRLDQMELAVRKDEGGGDEPLPVVGTAVDDDARTVSAPVQQVQRTVHLLKSIARPAMHDEPGALDHPPGDVLQAHSHVYSRTRAGGMVSPLRPWCAF